MNQNKTTLANRRIESTPPGLVMMTDIYVDHARGAEVWDIDGNRYIDFASGTSTMNVGHSHPKVVHALHQQVDKFTHTFFQQLPYESYVRLAERLNKITPGNFNKSTVLLTDGATAVENALKAARAFTRRSAVISFHGCFHGRTLYTTTLAGRVKPYKDKMGAPVGEVYHLPFKYESAKEALRLLFKHTVDPQNVAAIIIEPIQGEGGFNVAEKELLLMLREACNTHGIVMIVDEIQSGFARTGKMFAIQHIDVVPDIICMSKSIAAGIPMSAVTGKREIMQYCNFGGTYSGNPLGCVAAHAVLDIIEEEKLETRSLELGLYLRRRLNKLMTDHSFITDVRGVGSMIAMQVDTMDRCKMIQREARDRGLILITAGVDGNVIRFLYPLTIQHELLDEGIDILKEAIDASL